MGGMSACPEFIEGWQSQYTSNEQHRVFHRFTLFGRLLRPSVSRNDELVFQKSGEELCKNLCISTFHPRNLFALGEKKPGSDLLSHAVASTVPSAQMGLTSLFGMGRGVSPSV